jgi:hypothetical protein
VAFLPATLIEIQIMRERGKERIGRNSATILPFTHRYTRAVPKTLPYFSGLVIIMPTIAIIIHQPSDYRVLVTILVRYDQEKEETNNQITYKGIGVLQLYLCDQQAPGHQRKFIISLTI